MLKDRYVENEKNIHQNISFVLYISFGDYVKKKVVLILTPSCFLKQLQWLEWFSECFASLNGVYHLPLVKKNWCQQQGKLNAYYVLLCIVLYYYLFYCITVHCLTLYSIALYQYLVCRIVLHYDIIIEFIVVSCDTRGPLYGADRQQSLVHNLRGRQCITPVFWASLLKCKQMLLRSIISCSTQLNLLADF